uniref:Uncharacterized protein n=1 Tax=Onchocerca volvulus TaxID=6282 RepID=A0A8R1Y3D1_ONCVO
MKLKWHGRQPSAETALPLRNSEQAIQYCFRKSQNKESATRRRTTESIRHFSILNNLNIKKYCIVWCRSTEATTQKGFLNINIEFNKSFLRFSICPFLRSRSIFV